MYSHRERTEKYVKIKLFIVYSLGGSIVNDF